MLSQTGKGIYKKKPEGSQVAGSKDKWRVNISGQDEADVPREPRKQRQAR